MKKIFSLLLVAVCFHVQAALANPFLTPTVLGDNQFIFPTNTASFTIRLTNTGDAPFIWASFSGTIGPIIGPIPIVLYSISDGFPPNNGNVAVGGFLDIAAHFVPISGAAFMGQYMSDFHYDFSNIDDIFIQSVDTTAHWGVAEILPEPPLLALLGIGLAALAAFRRRKV
jgi:hypothetical protein